MEDAIETANAQRRHLFSMDVDDLVKMLKREFKVQRPKEGMAKAFYVHCIMELRRRRSWRPLRVKEGRMSKGEVEQMLAERGARYGAFSGHARITQGLKDVMKDTSGWGKLRDDQKEALEMVVHKIGRVLNGDPNWIDSWVDIVGYAQLVVDELKKRDMMAALCSASLTGAKSDPPYTAKSATPYPHHLVLAEMEDREVLKAQEGPQHPR